ncbi:hypothetical protein Golob_002300 [Gossypium lobatum]|uniref:Uncharacterized protein n=1 Tax=Gossypium lobatum TaxID=34289 RepID=A0A7J8N4P3_9ROSI|nr:hypothetical protein [Gossypium lobatum]
MIVMLNQQKILWKPTSLCLTNRLSL